MVKMVSAKIGVKSGTTKKNIHLLLKRIEESRSTKGIDAYQYCGTIKLQTDALVIQKALRNEWK